MLPPMTDEQLIAYCESHCKTERALFRADHVNRMSDLAGGYCLPVKGWVSVHEDMEEMCKLARENLAKANRPKPVLRLIQSKPRPDIESPDACLSSVPTSSTLPHGGDVTLDQVPESTPSATVFTKDFVYRPGGKVTITPAGRIIYNGELAGYVFHDSVILNDYGKANLKVAKIKKD